MTMNKKPNGGFALVFTIVMMFFVMTVGVSMVIMSRQEMKNIVRENAGNKALYLADAGLEYSIDRIKNVSMNAGITDYYRFGDGGFKTEVSATGITNTYDIISTGYVPDNTSPMDRKRVVARVRIEPEQPPFSIQAGSSITLSSNMTIMGNIRSNYKITIPAGCTITESAAGMGDANIYTNSSGASGIEIDTNFDELISNCAFKSRGPTNASLGGIDTAATGIYKESNIGGAGSATLSIVENDSSSDTDFIPEGDFPYFNLSLLVADTTFATRYTVSNTLNLAGRIFRFDGGVEFKTGSGVSGDGTIWVPTGTGAAGIQINSNVSFGSTNGRLSVNLIITGSRWDADISLESNLVINGYIYGETFVAGYANVNVEGLIECAGKIQLASNTTVTYADIGFPLPGSSGNITILSWRQEPVQ